MKLYLRMIISASVATWATLLSSLSGNTTEPMTTDHQLSQRMASLNQAVRVSTITGMNVRNLQGEKLGVVDNLLVDLHTARLVAVVITSGGFLGMGKIHSAIPPMAMRFSEGGDFLQMDVTKEWLSNAPHFTSQQWPDFARPEVTLGLYQAYGIDLDSSWFQKAEAMNAAEGARNTESDRPTTMSIRDIIASENQTLEMTKPEKAIIPDGEASPEEAVAYDHEANFEGAVDYDETLLLIRSDAANQDSDGWVVDTNENKNRP